jgi:type IV pilus assembly protein PilE
MLQAEERVMYNRRPNHVSRSSRSPLGRQAGVTLLELMAVVAVIGVLGFIAIPSYQQYARRAHRTEAKAALLRLATNQERFYLQNRAYSTTVDAGVGFAGPTSENGVYDIALATVNGWTQDYTATATPHAGGGTNGVDQAADTDCTSFTLSSTGQRTATGNQAARCW